MRLDCILVLVRCTHTHLIPHPRIVCRPASNRGTYQWIIPWVHTTPYIAAFMRAHTRNPNDRSRSSASAQSIMCFKWISLSSNGPGAVTLFMYALCSGGLPKNQWSICMRPRAICTQFRPVNIALPIPSRVHCIDNAPLPVHTHTHTTHYIVAAHRWYVRMLGLCWWFVLYILLLYVMWCESVHFGH